MAGLLDFDQIEIFNAAIGRQKLGITLYSDAPSNGATYGRQNGMWVSLGAIGPSGNLTETISSILTITGGTGAVNGAGTTIQVKQASTSQSGFLSSADWNTFNGKLGSLTATAPLTLTGTTFAIPKATASVNGYLASADWTTFNNKQPAGAYLTDAPSDGTIYGRQTGAWVAAGGGGGGGLDVTGLLFKWIGNGTPNDSGILANNGTLQGGATYGTGVGGQAFSLNGSTAYISTAQAQPSPVPQMFSTSCWFKTTSTNGGTLMAYAAQQTGVPSASFDWPTFIQNNGTVGAGFWIGSAKVATSAAAFNDGNWHFLVAVFNHGGNPNCGVALYADGVYQASASSAGGTLEDFSGYWRLGLTAYGGWSGITITNPFFDGLIQDARVWWNALNPINIAALFAAGPS